LLSISLHIKPNIAYDLFVTAQAARTGKTPADIETEITPQAYETKLRALHVQYTQREITPIRMADVIGVSVASLHNMLETMGLPLRGAHPRFCSG
jgi:hypothetical protein